MIFIKHKISLIIILVLLLLKCLFLINNDLNYFDTIKEVVSKEVNMVKFSKDFFGKFSLNFFEDDDTIVSSDYKYYKLSDGSYYYESNSNKLYSLSSGVCIYKEKTKEGYILKIQTEEIIIVYKEVLDVNINLYDYVNVNDYIGELKYINKFYFKVKYEY